MLTTHTCSCRTHAHDTHMLTSRESRRTHAHAAHMLMPHLRVVDALLLVPAPCAPPPTDSFCCASPPAAQSPTPASPSWAPPPCCCCCCCCANLCLLAAADFLNSATADSLSANVSVTRRASWGSTSRAKNLGEGGGARWGGGASSEGVDTGPIQHQGIRSPPAFLTRVRLPWHAGK